MTPEEGAIARKRKEDEECLERIQQLVQEKIVPIDPSFVIGTLGKIDLAVDYYIELAERRNKALNEFIGKLVKQRDYVKGCIGHPNCIEEKDYYIGSTVAYTFCIDELKKIILK